MLASATSPDDILDAITEEGVTITALVPAMVTVCMEMLEWDEDFDISSLRIFAGRRRNAGRFPCG